MAFSQIQMQFIQATFDTGYMLLGSLAFTVILGLPLGIILFLTSPKQLLAHRLVYNPLSLMVNVFRSPPFIILLITLMPFTKWLVGTRIGVLGAIPPLVMGATPFFARIIETALKEVDKGVIEAAVSMGSPIKIIICKVLLPESKAGIIAAITVVAVLLLSYTAIAGVVGAGGLGDLAKRYGYDRSKPEYMWPAVILLTLMVQGLQMLGDYCVTRYVRK